ncbi:carboxymethylenebutenolidase [Planoprotostelium fungivorum]|uniref:Carboxymethylenebutenolidase n=1 Tax=Planoprotostelium fungivorum TaxID=1890364 RepID=A0A2P6NAL4_9EUKA|nr:carboxymethylenebutenolidase [Planoprotostelium fungivorum]
MTAADHQSWRVKKTSIHGDFALSYRVKKKAYDACWCLEYKVKLFGWCVESHLATQNFVPCESFYFILPYLATRMRGDDEIATRIDRGRFPGVVVFSEIYQVTGPVARFARQIASNGFICAAPSSFHEFEPSDPLPYDNDGTDRGNRYKIEKELAAYDEDAKLTIDTLLSLPTCTGRIGATGMCLGGHLAFRAAFDRRVHAACCYFATDIHSHTLGRGKKDDSLDRVSDIRGELVMIFGKQDTHVPAAGRDQIRKALHDAGVTFSWFEPAHAQHAFIRDELSKGRYDAALSGVCWTMMMEVFHRTIKVDLGEREGSSSTGPEHFC